jgi:transposase
MTQSDHIFAANTMWARRDAYSRLLAYARSLACAVLAPRAAMYRLDRYPNWLSRLRAWLESCQTRNITTFLAGLRDDGIVAPLVIDGAMNGEIFVAYVRQFLVPVLRLGDHGIMDNLAVHKVAGVRTAIENAGAMLLYLPPYSPDLNPIEMAFSKLKALLRNAAERTMEALWDRIGSLIPAFTASDCRSFMAHQGYVST